MVRRQMLASGLGHQGEAKALVAALVLRVVWLLSEALVSGILYLSGPGTRKTRDK